MVHKIIKSGQPSYLAERFQLRSGKGLRGQGEGMIMQSDKTLAVSRGGFVYRGSRLFNLLSANLRVEQSLRKFKDGVRNWIKKNIKIKP